MTVTPAALFALVLGYFIFALLFYRRHDVLHLKENNSKQGIIVYDPDY